MKAAVLIITFFAMRNIAVYALRINPPLETSPKNSEKHLPKDMKLIQLIGDSIDRFMIDDWCELHKEDGSELLFGQASTGRFGHWADFGKFDSEFNTLLNKSGVKAWESWQSRICKVDKLGIAAAFTFNPKGIDTEGPWFHQSTIENLWNTSFCGRTEDEMRRGLKDSVMPDCHDFKRFLGPALKAVQARVGKAPKVIVVSSNAWDVDRVKKFTGMPWESFQTADFKAEWQRNATNLINSIKSLAPDSKLIWHTNGPGQMPANGDASAATPVKFAVKIKDMVLELESIIPGTHKGVLAVNSHAREMCKKRRFNYGRHGCRGDNIP